MILFSTRQRVFRYITEQQPRINVCTSHPILFSAHIGMFVYHARETIHQRAKLVTYASNCSMQLELMRESLLTQLGRFKVHYSQPSKELIRCDGCLYWFKSLERSTFVPVAAAVDMHTISILGDCDDVDVARGTELSDVLVKMIRVSDDDF